MAGRDDHQRQLSALLGQDVVRRNLALPGLRGAGKTVLLDRLKDTAVRAGWTWIQSGAIPGVAATEDGLARGVIADLGTYTSPTVDERGLRAAHEGTRGLAADKLVAVLRLGVETLLEEGRSGVVFAYDDAHHLAPAGLLLEAFARIQQEGVRALLVLAGLPSLFTRLAEAGANTDRMFTVARLGPLSAHEAREAVLVPLEGSPVALHDEVVDLVVEEAAGHPYFVQYWSRGVYDLALQGSTRKRPPHVPLALLRERLDDEFYVGPWERLTDRQRDLLRVVASLDSADSEFSITEIQRALAGAGAMALSKATVNVRLADLAEQGLVYKQRHGRYCLALPLLEAFVRRQSAGPETSDSLES